MGGDTETGGGGGADRLHLHGLLLHHHRLLLLLGLVLLLFWGTGFRIWQGFVVSSLQVDYTTHDRS
jgi:hypothetical protein